ncbi:MAG: glycine cleavage T C-terminal barrel domain-containing protein, partial [Gemmatimonadales bacterium]
LVGLLVEDKGIPRQGCEVRPRGAAQNVGLVTSGTLSPVLKRGIALAYVQPACSKPGTKVDIVIRGASSPATVAELPFVKGG